MAQIGFTSIGAPIYDLGQLRAKTQPAIETQVPYAPWEQLNTPEAQTPTAHPQQKPWWNLASYFRKKAPITQGLCPQEGSSKKPEL
ncbi:MAG TPA: hypothetical protein PLV25_06190 [Opitutales bacterium]|nr:hypothetical protein [Opitutales bacterium]